MLPTHVMKTSDYSPIEQAPHVLNGIAMCSVFLSVVAVLIALYSGFGSDLEVDRTLATPILAFYAVAVLAAAVGIRNLGVTCLGSGLLFVALVHGLGSNDTLIKFLQSYSLMPERPYVVACLIHATLAALIAGMAARLQRNRPEVSSAFSEPLGYSAMLSSALVVPAILWVELGRIGLHSRDAFWAAVVWLVVAIVVESRRLFAASQTLATIAVAFCVTAFCQPQDWWSRALFEPRHIQWQLGVLAVWCLAWTATRALVDRLPSAERMQRLMRPEWPLVDRVVLGGVAAGVVGLTVMGCLPGINEIL